MFGFILYALLLLVSYICFFCRFIPLKGIVFVTFLGPPYITVSAAWTQKHIFSRLRNFRARKGEERGAFGCWSSVSTEPEFVNV